MRPVSVLHHMQKNHYCVASGSHALGRSLMVEARWRQLVVSCDDPSADQQIAEAIARVVARYAVDLRSGVQVTMSQSGTNVTYVAKPAINLISVLRAARKAPAASVIDAPAAGSLDPIGLLKQLYAVAAGSSLHPAA